MMPSQSSSRLLQVSVAGLTPPMHVAHRPLTQVSIPGRQRPTIAWPHGRVVPSRQSHPSSTTPSQFSSPPLQSSGAGPIPPRQAPHTPAAQVSVPWRQSPTSLPHGREIPSTMPSQSSSAPLQVSPPAAGSTCPWQGPKRATPASITHASVPARQTPTPAVAAGPS